MSSNCFYVEIHNLEMVMTTFTVSISESWSLGIKNLISMRETGASSLRWNSIVTSFFPESKLP